MKLWVISAVIYVALVITSYSLITGENPFISGSHSEEVHDQH
ncbi:hypothetical protein [Alkalicoccobacillus porphyridii]|nr:hypothetical protein [Alkalicoccobacillus porphyridii]